MVKKTTSFTFADNYGVKNTAATRVLRVNAEDSENVRDYLRANEIPFHVYASGKNAYAIEVAEHILQGAVECDSTKRPSKVIHGYDMAISSREEIGQEVIRPLLDTIEKANQPLFKEDTLDYIGENFTVEEATFLNASFAAAANIESKFGKVIDAPNTGDEEIA